MERFAVPRRNRAASSPFGPAFVGDFVGFSRPQQLSGRLAALIFGIGSVTEGYPSAGWAAALHHLPAVLAIPIGLTTASGLLAALVWLMFFVSFP